MNLSIAGVLDKENKMFLNLGGTTGFNSRPYWMGVFLFGKKERKRKK